MTAWGTIVVGLIDNLIYPILVGNRLRQHTVIAFLAIVGGIALFGATGIILGPVMVTVTQSVLEIWRRRTARGGGRWSRLTLARGSGVSASLRFGSVWSD